MDDAILMVDINFIWYANMDDQIQIALSCATEEVQQFDPNLIDEYHLHSLEVHVSKSEKIDRYRMKLLDRV